MASSTEEKVSKKIITKEEFQRQLIPPLQEIVLGYVKSYIDFVVEDANTYDIVYNGEVIPQITKVYPVRRYNTYPILDQGGSLTVYTTFVIAYGKPMRLSRTLGLDVYGEKDKISFSGYLLRYAIDNNFPSIGGINSHYIMKVADHVGDEKFLDLLQDHPDDYGVVLYLGYVFDVNELVEGTVNYSSRVVHYLTSFDDVVEIKKETLDLFYTLDIRCRLEVDLQGNKLLTFKTVRSR